MDLEMPIMDGHHGRPAPARTRGRHGCERQLVGAHQQRAAGQIDAALAAGMDEVIVRPYRFPRLVKAVHLAVDRAERGEWGARE
jgi:CheY-like chemotaxis protein